MSESESKSSSDLPDFIPAHLLESEPFFERRGVRENPMAPPAREGLPPSYRMRADAHYVDQLAGPAATVTVHVLNLAELEVPEGAIPSPPALVTSVKRHGVLQPVLVQRRRGRYRVLDGCQRISAANAAGLTQVPCLLHDVDDEEAASLADAANAHRREGAAAAHGSITSDSAAAASRELARSLSALTSSANLLSPAAGGLSHLVAVDLIRAQLWRSSCLLESGRVLRGERPVALARVLPARVLDHVVDHLATEARLRGASLDLKTVDLPADAVLRIDERLLAVALSSMLFTTLALVEDRPRPLVAVAVTSRAAGTVAFEISQEDVSPAAEWASRAFEPAWVDRPGGASAAVLMLAAQRIAAAFGGRISVMATAFGTTMSLSVPTVAAN